MIRPGRCGAELCRPFRSRPCQRQCARTHHTRNEHGSQLHHSRQRRHVRQQRIWAWSRAGGCEYGAFRTQGVSDSDPSPPRIPAPVERWPALENARRGAGAPRRAEVPGPESVRRPDRARPSEGRGSRPWRLQRDSPSRVALLKHRPEPPPFDLLDFGCGPGRDLCTFKAMGHRVVGLEGAPSAAAMVRAHSGRSSECACRLMPRHSPARLGSAKRCLGSAGLRRRRLKLSAARVLQQEGVDVRQLPLLLRLGATLSVAAFVFQIQQDGLA